MPVSPKHVAIVGGGIAGLSTAHALHARASAAGLPLRCTLIEAERGWGGKIVTHHAGGFIIEAGPDSFLSQKPWALDLCEDLGLTDQLINTNESKEKACVFSRGRLRPLPEGLIVVVPTQFGPFLRSGLLSWAGIMRMAMEVVIPRLRRPPADESLASFFRRRLGREACERLIEPLMAGIYAGDAEQISLRATFPRFLDMEQRYGSVIRGVLASQRRIHAAGSHRAPVRTTFTTLRGGLGTLVDALVARIREAGTDLRSGVQVTALRARQGWLGQWMYDLQLDDGPLLSADAVVLATPAYVSGELVHALNRPAAELLAQIPYASTATVSLGYATPELGPSVKGFGFVVPRVEHRDLMAATWTSLKWSHRAPASHTLIRCYLGGIGREPLLKMDDTALMKRVREELRSLAGITAEPTYGEVNRWERGMPQYTLGHLGRLDQIHVLLRPYRGLYLTGAGYRGIGIPDCIRDASETAQQVIYAFETAK